MKHTPGPWSLETYEIWDGKKLLSRSWMIVDSQRARVEWNSLDGTDKAFSNSQLMAAAPELLAALKAMLDAFVEDPLENNTYAAVTAAYAAIAKATGETE